MTISVTAGTGVTGSGSSVSVTGVTIPVGSLVIVAAGEDTNSTTAGTVGDSAGNTYTIISGTTVHPNGSTANGVGAVFWAILTVALSSGSITYNTAGGGGTTNCGIGYMYATGAAASAPVDATVTATATGIGKTPSVTSGSPSTAGELFVASVFTNFNSGGFTQPGSFTSPWGSSTLSGGAWNASNAISMAGGSEVNAAQSSLTFNPTFNNSTNWAATIVGFKPLASSPSQTLPIFSLSEHPAPVHGIEFQPGQVNLLDSLISALPLSRLPIFALSEHPPIPLVHGIEFLFPNLPILRNPKQNELVRLHSQNILDARGAPIAYRANEFQAGQVNLLASLLTQPALAFNFVPEDFYRHPPRDHQTPEFIFPNVAAYANPPAAPLPVSMLSMLALSEHPPIPLIRGNEFQPGLVNLLVGLHTQPPLQFNFVPYEFYRHPPIDHRTPEFLFPNLAPNAPATSTTVTVMRGALLLRAPTAPTAPKFQEWLPNLLPSLLSTTGLSLTLLPPEFHRHPPRDHQTPELLFPNLALPFAPYIPTVTVTVLRGALLSRAPTAPTAPKFQEWLSNLLPGLLTQPALQYRPAPDFSWHPPRDHRAPDTAFPNLILTAPLSLTLTLLPHDFYRHPPQDHQTPHFMFPNISLLFSPSQTEFLNVFGQMSLLPRAPATVHAPEIDLTNTQILLLYEQTFPPGPAPIVVPPYIRKANYELYEVRQGQYLLEKIRKLGYILTQ